jgi:hypothetical protein
LALIIIIIIIIIIITGAQLARWPVSSEKDREA